MEFNGHWMAKYMIGVPGYAQRRSTSNKPTKLSLQRLSNTGTNPYATSSRAIKSRKVELRKTRMTRGFSGMRGVNCDLAIIEKQAG